MKIIYATLFIITILSTPLPVEARCGWWHGGSCGYGNGRNHAPANKWPKSKHEVPEIPAGSLPTLIALAGGGLAILRDRVRRR